MILWTDEEWDKLANTVVSMRLSDPAPALLTLVKRAVDSTFPVSRRRKVPAITQLQPLLDRVESIIAGMRTEAAMVQSMRDQLAARRSADEILDSLTDSEIMQRYGHRFLQMMTPDDLVSQLPTSQILETVPLAELCGEALRRYVSAQLGNSVSDVEIIQRSNSVKVTPRRNKLPRVLFVGLKGDQQEIVRKELQSICDMRFADKNLNESSLPTGLDLYVVWARFSRHAMTAKCKSLSPPSGYIEHMGGLQALIAEAQQNILKRFFEKAEQV